MLERFQTLPWNFIRSRLHEERGTLLAAQPDLGYFVTNDDSPGSGTTWGTSVTAPAATNTKTGAVWVSLLSTIDRDLYQMRVVLTDMNSAAATDNGLVDLGIGPDASNVTVICENLICGLSSGLSGLTGRSYWLPLFVPQGTQLWGRVSSSVSADTIRVAVQAWGGPSRSPAPPAATFIEAIGATVGSSVGTAVTPGNSGALGSYAQLTASTANAYFGLLGAFTSTDTTQSAVGYVLLLGAGAATEQELGLVSYGAFNASEQAQTQSHPIFCDIPASTRIAAKMSCTSTSDASITAIAYGLVA